MRVDTVDNSKVVRSETDRIGVRQPRERLLFGVPRARMSVIGDIPGHFLAWIHDDGGRIEEALLSGYQHVQKGEVLLAVGVVPSDSDLGSGISMVVGRNTQGGPLRAHLMKIPNEYREEAREYMREIRRKRMGSIKRGQMGLNGERNMYVPDHTNISISTKR